MKITHCIFSMETGGAEVLTVQLLNEACDEHEVSLIIINNMWNKILLNQLNRKVKVYYINRKPGSLSIIPLLKLNLLIRRLKPDIIHSHDPKVAKVIKWQKAKILHTIHDVGIPVTNYVLYDRLVAISDTVKRDVTVRSRLEVKKVYNGIPSESFVKRSDHELRSSEPLRLVQVSRLVHEKKGQDILLHALHKLRNNYGITRVKLDFIGAGSSLNYLKHLCKELELEDVVCFAGEKPRDWLYQNLRSYHALVQPSRYEGFGLTVLEGLAAGIPVLASDTDGPAELIDELPGGFLFENENTASCASLLFHIYRLYTTNSIAPLLEDAVTLIEEKYSLRSCSDGYIKEYEALLNN